MDTRDKSFVKLGYMHGVNDQDEKLPKLIDASKYGSLYIEGYEKGYEDAKTRHWYVVATSYDYKRIIHYMNDNGIDMNRWVESKDGATKFATRAIAENRLNQLLNAVGRGNYMITWEK